MTKLLSPLNIILLLSFCDTLKTWRRMTWLFLWRRDKKWWSERISLLFGFFDQKNWKNWRKILQKKERRWSNTEMVIMIRIKKRSKAVGVGVGICLKLPKYNSVHEVIQKWFDFMISSSHDAGKILMPPVFCGENGEIIIVMIEV